MTKKTRVCAISFAVVCGIITICVYMMETALSSRQNMHWEPRVMKYINDGFYGCLVQCSNCNRKDVIETPVGFLPNIQFEKCKRCGITSLNRRQE